MTDITIKLKKLDRRYLGSEHFTIMAQVYGNQYHSIIDYHIVRDWCFETFGKTVGIMFYSMIKENNSDILSDRWSYYDEDRRIFLKNEKDILLFKLRWS